MADLCKYFQHARVFQPKNGSARAKNAVGVQRATLLRLSAFVYFEKNGVLGLWRLHRLSRWQFNCNRRALSHRGSGQLVARTLPYNQGKANLLLGIGLNLFFLRNERLGPSEEPRKQVGHERGKFAC